MPSSQVHSGDPCAQCGHPFNPHVVVATSGDPLAGGLIFCPDCDCVSTWGVNNDRPPMPAPDVVAAFRKAVLGD